MPCMTGYCAGAEVGACDGCGAWVGVEARLPKHGAEYAAKTTKAVIEYLGLAKQEIDDLDRIIEKRLSAVRVKENEPPEILNKKIRSAIISAARIFIARRAEPKKGKVKDMPKRKKTKSRKVNVPHVEAEAIERRKLRVLAKIYALFRKGQKARARKMAAKLAQV